VKDYEPIMSWGEELAERFGDDRRGDEAEAGAFLERSARGGPALDLMARIAGLRLKERWAGWNREPVAATSGNLVSVYGR
jgi:hypothetical protein